MWYASHLSSPPAEGDSIPFIMLSALPGIHLHVWFTNASIQSSNCVHKTIPSPARPPRRLPGVITAPAPASPSMLACPPLPPIPFSFSAALICWAVGKTQYRRRHVVDMDTKQTNASPSPTLAPLTCTTTKAASKTKIATASLCTIDLTSAQVHLIRLSAKPKNYMQAHLLGRNVSKPRDHP